eukprot:scaffold614_cov367-Prasinococcus_capsulatus_cf.AAC.3
MPPGRTAARGARLRRSALSPWSHLAAPFPGASSADEEGDRLAPSRRDGARTRPRGAEYPATPGDTIRYDSM